MAKKLSLADEILTLARSPAKPRSWIDRVPADFLVEIERVRAAYQAGETEKTKTALAERIIAALADRGVRNISPRGVREWLSVKS
jgi:hypothetical protein